VRIDAVTHAQNLDADGFAIGCVVDPTFVVDVLAIGIRQITESNKQSICVEITVQCESHSCVV